MTAERQLACWLLPIALVAAVDPVVASAPLERAEASRYALIAETGPTDTGEQLAATLRDDYGFDVHYLPDATRDAVAGAMDGLFQSIAPYDEIFVHLAMPVLREPHLYFVPADGERESPWTLLPWRDVLDWLNALPTGAALVTYPTCARENLSVRLLQTMQQPTEPIGRGTWIHPELEELRYSKRPGPVDVLQVCDLEALRIMRLDPEAVPAEWRVGELTEGIHQALVDAAQSLDGINSQGLAERLSELPGFQVSTQRVPATSEAGFRFAPTGTVIEYQARYDEARSLDELARVIEDFFAAAADDNQLLPSLASFLGQIAIDPLAAASGTELEPRQALKLRVLAIEVLGRIDSATSRDGLITISAQAADSGFVRWQAISKLSRLRDLRPQDLAALRAALADDEPSVREAAVRSLGVAKDEQAAPRLAELVASEPEKRVRLAAMQALSSLEKPESRQLFMEALHDDDDEVRGAAAAALAQLGSYRETSEVLLERLAADRSDAVRQSAAFALGRTWVREAQTSVVDGLARALDSGPDIVAAAAASSLGRVGGRRAESILRRKLEARPESERVAVAVAEALGRVARPASVPVLVDAASSDSASLRRAAVSALGAIGTEEAIEVLFAKLEDPDPYVRREVQQALDQVKVKQQAVATRVDSRSAAVRLRSYQALVEDPRPDRVETLIQGLGDEAAEVREVVIRGLAQYADTDSVARVGGALQEGDVLTRQSAATVLGRMPDEPGDLVLGLLGRATEDRSSAVRAEAARSLGIRGDQRALEFLFTAAADPSADVRLAAAGSLGRFAHEAEVIGRLQRMAKGDSSHEVREAAIEALAAGYRPAKKW